jgi:hypothetical protein
VSDGLIIRALLPVTIASLVATILFASYSFVLRLSDAPLRHQNQVRAKWWFVGSLLLVRLIPGALLFYVIISHTAALEQEATIVRWCAWCRRQPTRVVAPRATRWRRRANPEPHIGPAGYKFRPPDLRRV